MQVLCTTTCQRYLQVVEALWEVAQPGQYHLCYSRKSLDDVNTDSANVAAQDMVEHTGNASFHSIDPSDPLLSLQLDADVNWNTDTGTTSHMMPHKVFPLNLLTILPSTQLVSGQ